MFPLTSPRFGSKPLNPLSKPRRSFESKIQSLKTVDTQMVDNDEKCRKEGSREEEEVSLCEVDRNQEPCEAPEGEITISGCEIVTNQEPFEGMLFESEEVAKSFYDDYGRRVGFVTRVLSSRKSEQDGSIISRGLGCRGGSGNQGKDGSRKRDRGREGCMAMILLKREKPGKWVVRKFVRDHTHPLVVQLQKSQRIVDEKDKKIQELTAELRVKKRLSAGYREQLLTFMKDVEDHNAHLSTKVQSVSDNLKELDAKRQRLLDHR